MEFRNFTNTAIALLIQPVAERLCALGLCLPSGSGMSDAELERVIGAVCAVRKRAVRS